MVAHKTKDTAFYTLKINTEILFNCVGSEIKEKMIAQNEFALHWLSLCYNCYFEILASKHISDIK